jgi:FdhD protein
MARARVPPLPADTAAVRRVEVVRDVGAPPVADLVAVESPLEVRLNGTPFAVVMRTPGADRDLALGFLFSEGLLHRRDEVARVDLDEEHAAVNVVFVRGRADAVAAALDTRRQIVTTSSCGMCGRHDLASLRVDASPIPLSWTVGATLVAALPGTLRASQPAFADTGGLHAAGLFTRDGRLDASAEDVGRHNAVDKLVGRMLDAGRLPLTDSLLFVSGRTSFEIVQKAWLAGIPLVAAVSAPSSLAVDLARAAGITLLGFVRDGRCNIYAHPERVTAAPR